MKSLSAILLAALMCMLSMTAVWADLSPEESGIIGGFENTEPLPLYSDEIGDYHLYENGAVKAYVRLNQNAVTVVMEGSLIVIYDADGNEVLLDFSFDIDAHPWIKKIADEFTRQNQICDENGEPIEIPVASISVYSPPLTVTKTEDDAVLEVEVEPEVETVGDYGTSEPLPLCSDEIGDYNYYENGTVKAYVRLNREAVDVSFEGIALRIYDLYGNEIYLDGMFSYDEHPWIKEIIDDYILKNTEYDEDGFVISTPPVDMPRFWNVIPDYEVTSEIFGGLYTDYSDTNEESAAYMPASASNPGTGSAFAVFPAVFAALAVVFKKR